jgi:VTC domain
MSSFASAEHLPLELLGTISLDELNGKAEMLERLDNKYVVDVGTMHNAIERLAPHFDVLEIDRKRTFTYETCYFDGSELPCYFDHHRGRRQRAKVRMRTYTDAGLCFVEVKLKDKRGVTIKKRLKYETNKFGILDERAKSHVHHTYRSLYGKAFPYELTRVLDMRYRRTTLVAKQGGERMTIDSNLVFFANGDSRAVDDGLFVVETKSANGNGIADRVLRALHRHPTAHCSKYCLGTVFMNRDLKHNKFRPALRKLQGTEAQVLKELSA